MKESFFPVEFNISNRFFYDKSLNTLDNDSYKRLYSAASEVTLNSNSISQEDPNLFNDFQKALDFLSIVADSEAAKEQACIEYYKYKIDAYIKNFPEESEIKKIYKQIREDIENLDVKNFEKDQRKLIFIMSSLRQKPQLFIRRLEYLKNPPNYSTLEEFQRNDPLIGYQTFLERILTEEDKTLDGLYQKIIEFIKECPNIGKFSNKQKIALVASIGADFRNYLLEYFPNLLTDPQNVLTKQFERYKATKNSYFLNLLKTAKENKKEENNRLKTIRTLLNDMSTELGIRSQEEYGELLTQIDELRKNEENGIEFTFFEGRGREISKLIKDLEKKLANLKQIKGGKGGKNNYFRLHTKTSHGDIQEVITTLIYQAFNVPGSAAIDTIGTMYFETDLEDIFPVFKQISNQIKQITSLSVRTEDNNTKVEDTLKNYTARYKEINTKIKEKLEKYYKRLKSSPNLEQVFITNESAKLYYNTEQSSAEFTGREISIAKALAQLNSIGLLEDLKGEFSDEIIHIIINLTSATSSQKDPLEKYLSIFAGMLMFEDIYNMAEEALKFATEKKINNEAHVIHLYNINETFVPASIVLKNIHKALSKTKQEIKGVRMAARVTINPYNKESLDHSNGDTYSREDWTRIGNDKFTKTTIQIHFLKGLFSIIKTYNLLGN